MLPIIIIFAILIMIFVEQLMAIATVVLAIAVVIFIVKRIFALGRNGGASIARLIVWILLLTVTFGGCSNGAPDNKDSIILMILGLYCIFGDTKK